MSSNRQRKVGVLLYLSPEENQIIETRLRETGIKNKSAYLRKMAVDGYIVNQDFVGLHDLIVQIKRIGTNLNQLAKLANTYGFQDVRLEEIQEMKKELKEVWQQLI